MESLAVVANCLLKDCLVSRSFCCNGMGCSGLYGCDIVSSVKFVVVMRWRPPLTMEAHGRWSDVIGESA